MGTYFSTSNGVSEIRESGEIVDKTCNKDNMIATSRFMNNHAPMSVSRKCNYFNGFKPTDEKITKKVEEKYAFSNKSYILPNCKVRIEFLKHPSNEFDSNSNEKSRIESDDYLNKVVDVTKLIGQLMSSKVILTKLKEPSTLKFPATRAISVHKNIDLDDDDDDEEEEKDAVASETVSDEYAHRYCDNCKMIKFARVKDPAWKNCSDCKIEMTYLCVKCNVKQYKRYPFLKLHLERCDGNDGKDIDTESNAADEKESTLIPDKNQFIAKQNQYANTIKKYCRYCPQCKSAKHHNVKPYKCKKCHSSKQLLLYMCTKCKKKYNNHKSIKDHVDSQCYWTNQYQCTQCEYSTTSWHRMRIHFKYKHTDQPSLKCEFCAHETKIRSNLIKHRRTVHGKFDKKVSCNICSYTTNFYRNLRRHKQLKH